MKTITAVLLLLAMSVVDLASLAVSNAAESSAESAATAPDWPTFVYYDMSGLSSVPASLRAKGFERIPVFYMCHMWNGNFGRKPTNCDNVDHTRLNYDVIRQRAEEVLGLPLVVIDIERTKNPTSEAWHMLSEDPQVVRGAVALWQEMIATFREVNPDTRIMIYKPIQRIWWPLEKNRRYPLMNLGQETIDARYRTSELLAPLFEDKTLEAWPSAYLPNRDLELIREDWRWQIDICKKLYQTRCVFALTQRYMNLKNEHGQRELVEPEVLARVIRELREDGADGVGIWLPKHMNNDRYLALVEAWAERGDAPADERVGWLSGIDMALDDAPPVAD